ncbi:50S ribosomal protein L18 [Candidatus Woesearchaeota archaeon]|nr:50S ribosomal protein L18 [Candidatus Woesearchaeota archaeon]
MNKKIKTVLFRRKREGKTDYRKRMYLLKSSLPRVVIRRSNKHILVQGVKALSKGDVMLCSAHTRELMKLGWKGNTKNTNAAYLVGLLFAKHALKKSIKNFVVDIGMQSSVKGGVIYAVVKGLIDGGLDVPCSKEVMPDDKRILGNHIVEWSKKVKNQFSNYAKNNLLLADIEKHTQEVKKKIIA